MNASARHNQEDNRVGGYFPGYQETSSPDLFRVNADGTPDLAFDVTLGFERGGEAVSAVLPVQDDTGDVIVAGGFTTYKGTLAERIARLSPTGILR